MRQPNVVFVFADQMRAQATGYAGDPNAETPALDRLAATSVNVTHAVSGHPVCCPYRASLLTGQYPLTHGVYINDVPLAPNGPTIADCFAAAGYDTAYIGKWHLYGSPGGANERRRDPIPREHRMGFETWKAFECNHDYMASPYYEGDEPEPKLWEGYDAIAQTDATCDYLRDRTDADGPFFLVLSWGPPHDPYDRVPEAYKARFRDREIVLRPNVADGGRASDGGRAEATETLRGYYAHIAALDDCAAKLLQTLEETGLADDTIFIFTSDHGDMHLSQGLRTKHVPWDESIRVPFLLRYPRVLGDEARELPLLLDAPDIMPTLLGLCDLPVPTTVEGRDLSPQLLGRAPCDPDDTAFLSFPVSYWMLRLQGLPPYRGVRTVRHTYVRSTRGPWLLYDNEVDPYQLRNLCDDPAHAGLQADLESKLAAWLARQNDAFLPGQTYLERGNLTRYREATCAWGTVPTPWTVGQEGCE